MNRREATNAARRIFGPASYAARTPAVERDLRFHIFSIGRGKSDGVVLFGTGADYESAIEHAKSTPNGMLAIKQAQAGKEFAKKALLSNNELEFADLVEEQSVAEALASGANEDAVAQIRSKFAKAKEILHESVSRAAETDAGQGTDGAGDRPDHEGRRPGSEQGGESISAPVGRGE